MIAAGSGFVEYQAAFALRRRATSIPARTVPKSDSVMGSGTPNGALSPPPPDANDALVGVRVYDIAHIPPAVPRPPPVFTHCCCSR